MKINILERSARVERGDPEDAEGRDYVPETGAEDIKVSAFPAKKELWISQGFKENADDIIKLGLSEAEDLAALIRWFIDSTEDVPDA